MVLRCDHRLILGRKTQLGREKLTALPEPEAELPRKVALETAVSAA